jgi:hypothetical protein
MLEWHRHRAFEPDPPSVLMSEQDQFHQRSPASDTASSASVSRDAISYNLTL